MQQNVIAQAINYANRSEHDGSGYTLLVVTTDGQELECDVYQKEGLPYLLRRSRDDGDNLRGTDVFFNPACVARVEVLW